MSGLINNPNTSGTFGFLPSNAEIIASAYARINIKRTELEQSHLQDAVSELNLFLAGFNNVGPNLAQVDLQTITLTQGTATYTVPAETVMIMDVFLTFATNPTADAYLYPMSRTEYAAISNKTQQGRPSQYWFDRLAAPTLTLYLVPDGNPYTLSYYRFRQVQDALIASGQTPEVPNRALDAIVAGLAHRLSRIYAPSLEQARKADAGEAWTLYAKQDVENVPLMITPGLHVYWRV